MCEPKILILDFGSQYTFLIGRRCRELGVSYTLLPCTESDENIMKLTSIKGVILSGSPKSVYEEDAPMLSKDVWNWFLYVMKIPIFGICYGMQLMIHQFGGLVEPSKIREFGSATISPIEDDILFLEEESTIHVWMSHADSVSQIAPGFRIIAYSSSNEPAVVTNSAKKMWGVQFHPEVSSTRDVKKFFSTFFFRICNIEKSDQPLKRYIQETIDNIHNEVKNAHVIGAVSGGVDSVVAAKLVQKAIGSQFHAIFVDTGLLREGDSIEIRRRLAQDLPNTEIIFVDASEAFLNALAGVADPEEKRRIVGKLFIDTFVAAQKELEEHHPPGTFDNAYLLQGTVFPDVIESMTPDSISHKIKTHHNVGGLPEKLHFKLLEPLREFFKDEVREWGLELGLPRESVYRHPFPGPGLAIRVISDVTREKLEILKRADKIYIEEIRKAGLYYQISQAFAVLLPDCFTVGVAGDQRLYGMTIGLRALETTDYMTGHWFHMPYDVLERCSTRIVNEVPYVNRVVYDISSKPPATIEWE